MAQKFQRGSGDKRMSRSKRRPYQEGDWFAVPLKPSGYAVGIIARASPRGILFGYFFAPRRQSVPRLEQLHDLSCEQATYAHIFSDMGLLRQEWPLIGQAGQWARAKWPMPRFVREDPISRKPRWLVRYSDDDPLMEIDVVPAVTLTAGLPSDGVAGHGFIEGVLSDLLPLK
jgi:hypothetical protein